MIDTRSIVDGTALTTDALFRSWGKTIGDSLVAAGLTKTTDTGQIDWTTVVRPGSSNANVGYEMYRFDDALQATKPVFIRIQYGLFGASVNIGGVTIGVGFATDGAGVLATPLTLSRALGTSSGSHPAGAVTASVGAGRASFLAPNASSSSQSWGFCVERTKDSSGANTGDGVIVVAKSTGTSTYQFRVIPTTGGSVPAADQTIPGALNTAQFSNFGGNVAMLPLTVALGKTFYSWCLGYLNTDLTARAPVTVTHFGGSHTYMPAGVLAGNTGDTATAVAFLHE